MLPTAAERNNPGMGSDSESSGCLSMDTHFTFCNAVLTQTSVKLVFREKDFLYLGVLSLLEMHVILSQSI